MTPDEAAGILGVAADARPDQIRARFQELHSEYLVRLTNAPTPNLKKLNQERCAGSPCQAQGSAHRPPREPGGVEGSTSAQLDAQSVGGSSDGAAPRRRTAQRWTALLARIYAGL